MSTENTQTDVASSDAGAESTSINTGVATQKTIGSLDELRQVAKTSGEADFKVKAIDETLKSEQIAVQAFTPNFKYKAALQEKEIEEFWRPLIKDADSEKRVKEVFSRLDGFDYVKSSRDKIQQEFDSIKSDYQSQAQVVQRVEGALKKGDLTSAFRQLGVKDEDIYKWTQQKLQMMELPPEQRKAFEEADSLRSQQEQMQEQMSQYQRLYEEQSVQARTMQLDFVLSRPEISQSAQAWDSLQGQSGAFRDLIIQEAQNAYYQTGRDLSAEQAAQVVMQKFGKALNYSGGATAPQAQPHSSQTPQVQQAQAKPVIPNVNGKGASPIKKAPKSLDDLKRMAKELAASESQNNY